MNLKVFIGVPTAEYGRHAIFTDYVNQLIKPEETIGASFHTNSAAWNRNLIIQEALDNQCSHIFFLDDDMAFAPDTLMKLLAHDKEIVSALYLSRAYPHQPVLFDSGITRHFLNNEDKGLKEAEAVGFGCLLVKCAVFHYMEKPWVRLGEHNPDQRNEDIGFCNRAKTKGFQIFCDFNTFAGHMGVATFWPNRIEDKWFTAIDTNGNEMVNVPQP